MRQAAVPDVYDEHRMRYKTPSSASDHAADAALENESLVPSGNATGTHVTPASKLRSSSKVAENVPDTATLNSPDIRTDAPLPVPLNEPLARAADEITRAAWPAPIVGENWSSHVCTATTAPDCMS